MSMQMSVVEQPDQFELEEVDVGGFNYRDFEEIMAGRPWLSKALDQERSTPVGDDFGYGPGWLFTSKEVEHLAKGLVAEAKASVDEMDDELLEVFRKYVSFFALAAQAQKAVLTVVS